MRLNYLIHTGVLSLLGLGMLWMPGQASAATDVFDQFFRYADAEHRDYHGQLPDEDVDPFSGNLHIVQTDLELPGKAGLDLRIVRSYSSKIWNRTNDTSLTSLIVEDEHSVLGYGWSFHMGRVKNPNATGQPTSSCSADYPVLEMPDGSSHVFYRSATDSTAFVSRDFWRMEQNCSVMGGGGKGTCVWSSDGVRYEFSPSNAYNYGTNLTLVWPLSKIADRFGNTIVMTYVSGGNGAVSTITDSYSRQVTFGYVSGSDGLRLSTMTANSKVYNYSYTAYATLGGGTTSPRRFLTGVAPPAGPSYKYTYGTSWSVAANQYALSSMTYPHGGSVAYTYNSANFYYGIPGFSVPFAVVATRSIKDRGGASLGNWSYAYNSPSSGMNTTTITRPDSKKDVYSMYGFGAASAGNLWKVGLTQQVSRADGAEVETRTWAASAVISNSLFPAPAYSVCASTQPPVDSSVHASLMTQRAVSRDGSTYTTSYPSFDSYGQPLSVSETGQGSRSTTWTYQYAAKDNGATLNLIRGLPTTQTVCVSSDCFSNTWTYNGQHYAKDSQTLLGIKTTFGYNSDGTVASVTNALGQKLSLSQYQYGAPTTVQFGSAFTVTQAFYWEGWLQSRTDGASNKTSYSYDAIGRTTLITPPVAPTTGYSYASDGSSVTTTSGKYQKTTSIDGLGRTTGTSDSEGTLTSVRYDSMGRASFKSYPYDSSLGEVGDQYAFDGLNRVTTHTKAYRPASGACDASSACATTFVYAANCVTSTEQRGSSDVLTTKSCNTSYGNPDEQRLSQLTDAAGKAWSYQYSAFGKLLQTTAPLSKANRSFVYDSTTQFMKSEASAETGGTTYQPNELGQVKSRTDARSITTTYGYNDPLSRLRTISYSGSSGGDDVTRDYDLANNLKSVSSANGGTLTYGYDGNRRIRTQTWNYGGQTYQTSFDYDSYGCLYSVRYPSGLQLTITCDTANRPTSISTGGSAVVSNVLYHPSDQVKSMTYGDAKATASTVTYDDRARVKTASSSNSLNSIMGLSYTYDGVDNITTFADSAVTGSTRRMCASASGTCQGGYDALNRLVTVIAPSRWGAAVYDYDEVGNRVLKSAGTNTNTYSYGSNNRLDSFTGPSAIGSMILTWSSAGYLASSSDGMTYLYDALGRRIQKGNANQKTLFHYDPNGRVIGETAINSSVPNGTKLRDYIYLGNRLIAVDGCMDDGVSTSCSTRQWYYTDTLGSPLARTDGTGTVVSRFEYQPWGEEWSHSGVPGDREYNGRVYDSGTGFHDYGARMYWPEIGRFISADSFAGHIESPATLNLYAYVTNNPYRYTDPTGHQAAEEEGEANRAGLPPEDVGSLLRAARMEEASNRVEAKQPGGSARMGPQGPPSEENVRSMERLADNVDPPPEIINPRTGLPVGLGGLKFGSAGGPGAGKRFPESVKDAAEAEAEGKCVFCGQKTTRQPGPSRRNTDHAIPKSRGGNNTPENAQNACQTCNLQKGTKTTEEHINGR